MQHPISWKAELILGWHVATDHFPAWLMEATTCRLRGGTQTAHAAASGLRSAADSAACSSNKVSVTWLPYGCYGSHVGLTRAHVVLGQVYCTEHKPPVDAEVFLLE